MKDQTTAYARGVASGKHPAGPHVRGACARHLRDLEASAKRGAKWTFDVEAAERAISFFKDVLAVDNTQRTKPDDPDTVPFVLLPWQAFIVGSLFGWKGRDGFRRFRTVYVESGKGSGKSPLAAGVGLICLHADKEPRAEVYAAASAKDQARVLFRDAVAMVKASPNIAARSTFSGGEGQEWNIAALATGSFFRIVAADTGQSGPRPHCALLDEVHEHPTDHVVKMMRAGTKGRRQAILFMITNSGADRTGVCWDYHEYAAKVCQEDEAGRIKDDAFFAYVCALDGERSETIDGVRVRIPADDPFKSEECWPKANPSIGVTFQPKYLRELVTQARGMPSSVATVLRLNFCVWTDALNPWIDLDRWESAEQEQNLEELAGLPCSLGLDLSSKRDLTALAAAWRHPDGRMTLAVWFWTPGDTLDEHAKADRVPYRAWVDQGFVNAPPGRIIDYDHVALAVQELTRTQNVEALAFDKALIDDFEKACQRVGFEVWIDDRKRDDDGVPETPDGVGLRLVRHGQGFAGYGHPTTLWMPRSINEFEAAIVGEKIRIKRNPCLRWNSASAVLAGDATGNRKWEKQKSNGRIDGMVAASMAVGLCSSGTVETIGSVWDRPELWDS